MTEKDKHEQRRVFSFFPFIPFHDHSHSHRGLENRLETSWFNPGTFLPAWSCSCPQHHHHEPEFTEQHKYQVSLGHSTTLSYLLINYSLSLLSSFCIETLVPQPTLTTFTFHFSIGYRSQFFIFKFLPSLRRPWSDWLNNWLCVRGRKRVDNRQSATYQDPILVIKYCFVHYCVHSDIHLGKERETLDRSLSFSYC